MMFVTVTLLLMLAAFFWANWRYRWIYILMTTYKRDFRLLSVLCRICIVMKSCQYRNKTVAKLFSETVRTNPQKIAFYFEDEIWTFAQVQQFSNKIGKYFHNQGFKKGDCIALMLENRAEYPCIWLGLAQLGVITALINTNVIGDSLLHCVKAANCKALIFGSNYIQQLKIVCQNLPHLNFYQFDETIETVNEILPECINLRNQLEGFSCEPLKYIPKTDVSDPLLYIYTSGTTGLPKAAVVTNLRFIFAATAAYCGTFCKSDDVVYVPLPLYHSAGGMLAIGLTLVYGLTAAIRKKFSAKNYWKDCAKYNCTRAQYVGEMCRYILTASRDTSIKHSVKAIMGNGLNPQIWKEFINKFGIKNVYEYYGSTEGIANMVNTENTVGSVGFIPRYVRPFYPVTLIKCNRDTGEPIRDKSGYCIESKVNEPGLAVAKINHNMGIFTFKGYSDKEETQKKILRHVFSNKDMYFSSGDILEGDEFGNFYFKDRIGDTFRWKGENVSTSEVEAVISNIVQLQDAVVYGVEVQNVEGRAGMVTIADSEKLLDIDVLSKRIKQHLPKYAIPLFTRVVETVPLTGTFKLQKTELKAEGYNINVVKDPVYIYDADLEKYISLTPEIYQNIVNGTARL